MADGDEDSLKVLLEGVFERNGAKKSFAKRWLRCAASMWLTTSSALNDCLQQYEKKVQGGAAEAELETEPWHTFIALLSTEPMLPYIPAMAVPVIKVGVERALERKFSRKVCRPLSLVAWLQS